MYKLVADDKALFRNFTQMCKEDFQYLLEKDLPIIKTYDISFREAISPHLSICFGYLSQAFLYYTRGMESFDGRFALFCQGK